jgi:hypothetical protein
MYFDKASAKLTALDQAMLRAYASAYVAAKTSEPIVVEGYASTEGAEVFNKNLSKQRADSVAEFLKKQGVPKDKVASHGRGVTNQFSKDDLRPNRRATLKPPPTMEGPSITVKNDDKRDAPRQKAVVRPIRIRDVEYPSMVVGQEQGFKADYSDSQPGDMDPAGSPTVAWISSKPDVVKIDYYTGRANALKAGTAEIRATDMSNLLPEGGGRDSITIKVYVPLLQGIIIESDPKSKVKPEIVNGMLHHMKAMGLFSADDYPPTDFTKEAVWASSDNDMVKIIENGVAQGQKKLGTAKITASYGDFVGSIEIKVYPLDLRPRIGGPKGPTMGNANRTKEQREHDELQDKLERERKQRLHDARKKAREMGLPVPSRENDDEPEDPEFPHTEEERPREAD